MRAETVRAHTRRWGDIWFAAIIAVCAVLITGFVLREVRKRSAPSGRVAQAMGEIAEIKADTDSLKTAMIRLEAQLDSCRQGL